MDVLTAFPDENNTDEFIRLEGEGDLFPVWDTVPAPTSDREIPRLERILARRELHFEYDDSGFDRIRPLMVKGPLHIIATIGDKEIECQAYFREAKCSRKHDYIGPMHTGSKTTMKIVFHISRYSEAWERMPIEM